MSYTENAGPATTSFGTALAAAGINPADIMATAEAGAPNKKDTKNMTNAKPAAPKKPAAAKSPIVRLYSDPVGKKVVLGDFTFLIGQSDKGARKFEVVRAKGDELLTRFVFQHELDYEELGMKVGGNVEMFDDKVKLHALLRPLAVEAGLAKPAAPKPKTNKPSTEELLMREGATGLDYVETRGIRRQRTQVLEQSISRDALPVGNFGIERLLKAPVGVKVGLGQLQILVEEDEEESRFYRCVRAPEDQALDIWVKDFDIRRPYCYIPSNMSEAKAYAKRWFHAEIRNAAIDAGLLQGERVYVPKHDAIDDRELAIKAIREGITGKFILRSAGEKIVFAIGQTAWAGNKFFGVTLLSFKDANSLKSLGALKVHAAFPLREFLKGLRPSAFRDVESFADWLEEAVGLFN